MASAPDSVVITVFMGRDGRLYVDKPEAMVRIGGKVVWYSKLDNFGVVFSGETVVPDDCQADDSPPYIPKLQQTDDALGEIASSRSTVIMEAENVSAGSVYKYDLAKSGPIVKPPRFSVTVVP